MDNLGYGIDNFDRDDAVYELSGETHVIDDRAYSSGSRPTGMHVSGTQLRRRLITPEAIAAIHEPEPKRSLVQSLLGRVRKHN